MATSDFRGIPRRPRPTRSENGPWAGDLLATWQHLVERSEQGPQSHCASCPLCDGQDGLDARDELERLVKRAGKRGVRLEKRLAVLDERFRRATTPQPFSPLGAGWWRTRNHD